MEMERIVRSECGALADELFARGQLIALSLAAKRMRLQAVDFSTCAI